MIHTDESKSRVIAYVLVLKMSGKGKRKRSTQVLVSFLKKADCMLGGMRNAALTGVKHSPAAIFTVMRANFSAHTKIVISEHEQIIKGSDRRGSNEEPNRLSWVVDVYMAVSDKHHARSDSVNRRSAYPSHGCKVSVRATVL